MIGSQPLQNCKPLGYQICSHITSKSIELEIAILGSIGTRARKM